MREIKIPLKTFQLLLLESFRYCIGQQTMCIFDCIDTLEKYWDILPIGYQRQIQGDIILEIEMDKKHPQPIRFESRKWGEVLRLEVKRSKQNALS